MKPLILAEACDIPLIRAQQWADPIAEALNLGKCRTPEQIAVFLATCGHESAGFTRLVESLNYTAAALVRTWPGRFSDALALQLGRRAGNPADQQKIAEVAYGGRMGNNATGDGWKYRGRGIIQLTGKDNYQRAGKALNEPYASNPDMVAEPRHAALTAGQWWSDNRAADLGGDILSVSRLVNVGNARSRVIPHGWDDRRQRYAKALAVLRGNETPGEAVRRMLG